VNQFKDKSYPRVKGSCTAVHVKERPKKKLRLGHVNVEVMTCLVIPYTEPIKGINRFRTNAGRSKRARGAALVWDVEGRKKREKDV